jgi:hypothetical protein
VNLAQRFVDAYNALQDLSPEAQDALLGLLETALAVKVAHEGDARGADAWLQQTADCQVSHTIAHLEKYFRQDADGLSEASHAACRLAFLLALRKDLRA